MPQPPKKINVDDNNLAPHGDLYLQLDKIIDHLPDSAEGKARCSLHGWFGIETHKDVMYFNKFNVNLCVLCYNLFHSYVDILNIKDSISTRFKMLKSRKSPISLLVCGIKFYVTPTQPFFRYGEDTPTIFPLPLTQQLNLLLINR